MFLQTLKTLGQVSFVCSLRKTPAAASSPVPLPEIAHTPFNWKQLITTSLRNNHRFKLFDQWSHLVSDSEVWSASFVCADCHAYCCGAVHRYENHIFSHIGFFILLNEKYVCGEKKHCAHIKRKCNLFSYVLIEQLVFKREICKSERRLFIGSSKQAHTGGPALLSPFPLYTIEHKRVNHHKTS